MKLPDAAHIVFSGKIFDVYQWEQAMYDGTNTTFEMLKRPDTVQVIPTMGNKIFLSYEEQPTYALQYSFLGGRCEKGEEPLAAAKRELLEESGFESSDLELFKSFEPFHKIDWQIHYFIARNCKRIKEPQLDAGEKLTVKEFSFEQFVSKVTETSFGMNHFSYELLRIRDNPEALQKLKLRLCDKIIA